MTLRRQPRLSLDLLRGFCAAARHLSFTAAAKELSVTQSAVSHEVKAIEEQLGTLLFHRVNRTLRLTEAGERIYRATSEALGLIDDAVEVVTGTSRILCITATVPFASLWLGPRLAGFTRLRPELSLRIIASNDNLDMAREGIDIAIRHSLDDTSQSLQDSLCDYEIFPVCSPALAERSPINALGDLTQHVLLDFETIRNGRPWFDWQLWFEAMKIRRLKPAGLLRFTHYDQVIEAALAGSGVAMGRWPHLSTYLNSGTLIAPLADAGVARLGRFHAIARTSSQASTEFLAWLRMEMNDDIGKHSQPATAGRRAPPPTRRRVPTDGRRAQRVSRSKVGT
jgi:LysR family transcriptional regulator, glycine cleavage system transcriptional activator